MNNIRYNFALDVNGKRRHINEKCSPQPFRCGDCNEEMVARRGGENRWHYAHKARTFCEPRPDPDNALHRYAQDIIIENFNRRRDEGGEYWVGLKCLGYRATHFDLNEYDPEFTDCPNIVRRNVVQRGAIIHKEKTVVPGTKSDVVVEVPNSTPVII